jgi:hypothetical protein
MRNRPEGSLRTGAIESSRIEAPGITAAVESCTRPVSGVQPDWAAAGAVKASAAATATGKADKIRFTVFSRIFHYRQRLARVQTLGVKLIRSLSGIGSPRIRRD